jgi:hypothetical protein
LRHVFKAIRRLWPRIDMLIRSGGTTPGTIFGLAGNKALLARITDLAEDAVLRQVEGRERQGPPLRRVPLRCQEMEGSTPGRHPIEASAQGTDTRFVAKARCAGSTRRSTAPVAKPRI